MGQVKVNADVYVYKVPNPEAGQPPLARTAYLGEVIDVDATEERRGRGITVNRDYPYGTTTVRSQEPALVDVDHDADVTAAEAARQARIRQLKEQLAALDVAEAPTVATGGGPHQTMVVDDPEARAEAALAELAQLRDAGALDSDTLERLAGQFGLDVDDEDEPGASPAPAIPPSSPAGTSASADYPPPGPPAVPAAPPAPPAPVKATGAAKKTTGPKE